MVDTTVEKPLKFKYRPKDACNHPRDPQYHQEVACCRHRESGYHLIEV